MVLYYKVVNCNMQSITTRHSGLGDLPLKYVVTYKVGEWVGPRVEGTRLFCFKNLYDAKRFAYGERGNIYECEVKNPAKVKALCFLASIDDFWNNILQYRKLKKKLDRYPDYM